MTWYELYSFLPPLLPIFAISHEDRDVGFYGLRQDSDVNDDTLARFEYKVFTQSHDQILDTAVHPGQSAALRKALLDTVIDAKVATGTKLARLLQDRNVGSTWAVSILVDHSGSMVRPAGTDPEHRTNRYDLVVPRDSGAVSAAGAAITIACALEKCGAATEILGFTTREWRGGNSRQDWIRAGAVSQPGRLNDLLHIIYKKAHDDSVIACLQRLERLLDPALLKENIDGEAVSWARERLLDLPASKRVLIVISDGAPVDDSTILENGPNFLARHLNSVIKDIEQRPDFKIVAIGIGFDLSDTYAASVAIDGANPDLDHQLTQLADLIAEPSPLKAS